jgi:hypothetical protein
LRVNGRGLDANFRGVCHAVLFAMTAARSKLGNSRLPYRAVRRRDRYNRSISKLKISSLTPGSLDSHPMDRGGRDSHAAGDIFI